MSTRRVYMKLHNCVVLVKPAHLLIRQIGTCCLTFRHHGTGATFGYGLVTGKSPSGHGTKLLSWKVLCDLGLAQIIFLGTYWWVFGADLDFTCPLSKTRIT
ncbi:hypothetical protein CsatB_022502 [Cannabis sativa]